jgi:hypothetical protein
VGRGGGGGGKEKDGLEVTTWIWARRTSYRAGGAGEGKKKGGVSSV